MNIPNYDHDTTGEAYLMQLALQQLGYYTGKLDNDFGDKSKAALAAYRLAVSVGDAEQKTPVEPETKVDDHQQLTDAVFVETRRRVEDQGRPPFPFLREIVEWARTVPDEVFAENDFPHDVFGQLEEPLGPWIGEPGSAEWFRSRKAALLELMRVHAGFESSWDWTEGVDTTNQTSMRNKEGEETGIFQVSFDSTYLGGGAMKEFANHFDIASPENFIPAMKKDHKLALDYYARLMRVNYKWAGPVLRHEIDPYLSREAAVEFSALI